MLQAKYYNFLVSSPPFDTCTSKDVEQLANELACALSELQATSAVNSNNHKEGNTEDSESSTPTGFTCTDETQIVRAQAPVETPVTTNNANDGPRRRRLLFTPDIQLDPKKPKMEDKLQQSCENCLVSAASHYLAIENIELPSKTRQFRRVNDDFVRSLEVEMEKNPAGTYGALFVVAKGISEKSKWQKECKDSFKYEVLGGTHLSLATKKMHKKYPENPHFSGRMCRVYVGLTDEQAVYLGAMHQQSSMFQHEITYREEVERCRMQLFGGSGEISGDPPEPRPLWRDDCSRILCKEKKGLSEVFVMARVSKDVWKEFQEVNSMCEKGRLKDQKVSAADVIRGVVSLKQWHMKPICSLSDEERLVLLRKVKEREISLKELKNEAENVRALSQVQLAISNFFQLESWQEAVAKFGERVQPERLLRFKGNFEKLHEFKMFLNHLKSAVDRKEIDEEETMIFTGPDGVSRGQMIFSSFTDVDGSSSCFENGAFLSIGHVGNYSEDVVNEVNKIVDLVVKINFARLMTIFNLVIICPTDATHELVGTLKTRGAGKVQQGFIVNRGMKLNENDLLMTDVVESFLVGHWAVSREVMVTERHVSRPTTNVIDVNCEEEGQWQPKEVYRFLIETFSLKGDLILDLGSGNGNGLLTGIEMQRSSIYIEEKSKDDEKWYIVESIKEQLQQRKF